MKSIFFHYSTKWKSILIMKDHFLNITKHRFNKIVNTNIKTYMCVSPSLICIIFNYLSNNETSNNKERNFFKKTHNHNKNT
jgi:hypothetical protein